MSEQAHAARLPAVPSALRGERARRWSIPAVLAVLWAALAAVHFWWLVRFRRGFPVDVDESGYLWFSFMLHERLRADGIEGLLRGFQSQGHVGPLLPGFTAVVEVAAGARQIIPSMAVQTAFFGVLLFASYGVGTRLRDRRAGMLTALVVAATPAVSDFVRTYHLVLPGTAMYTLATFAVLASDRFRRRPWSLVAGVALGLTLLSRSMMVAFVPGLAVAAVWILAVDRADRRRLVNFALATLAFALTTLSWYATSWRYIFDYLLDFGYGAPAAGFGDERSLLSPAFWTHEATSALNSSLYLPLATMLVLGLALAAAGAALGARTRRPSVRAAIARAAHSDAVVPTLVVVEGYLALTSTRNDGTGFVVPLLPALIALTVAAVLTIPWRGIRVTIVSALVAVALLDVVMKTGSVAWVAEERRVDLPLVGPVVVTRGHGWIHGHLRSFVGYELGPPGKWLRADARGWLPLYEDAAAYAAAVGSGEPRVYVAPNEALVNYSVFRLRGSQIGSPAIFVHDFAAREDSEPAYRELLSADRPDAVFTTSAAGPEFGAPLTPRFVEAAARSLGFRLVRRFAMPDGRRLHAWTRGRQAAPGS